MRKLFGWTLLFALMAVVATPAQAQITGTNWTGTFYNNTDLSGDPVATELYPNGLYFNWGTGRPRKADKETEITEVNADSFSARFTSTQTFTQAGVYKFTVYADDGVRIYINDQLILNEFTENTDYNYRTFVFFRTISTPVDLDIRVEFAGFTGSAILVFQWGLNVDPPLLSIITYAPADGGTIEGDSSPSLQWENAGPVAYTVVMKDASGKRVFKRTASGAAICSAICTLDLGKQPKVVLKPGWYRWRVTANGANRVSSWSSFTLELPGKPRGLEPDWDETVSSTSPVLSWSDVPAANQYRVVLTRVKTGAAIKIGWLSASALGCDSTCALNLKTLRTPIVLKRGKYTWRVFARNKSLKANVSKSALAAFEVVRGSRSIPLSVPEAPAGFRAP